MQTAGQESDERKLARESLEQFARFWDSSFSIPGTRIRFGWDSLIGLIPGVGDFLGILPLFYFLRVALRHQLGANVCLLMAGNQLLDFAIGAIPVLGDVFDVAFKANERNARLLAKRLND